MYVIHFAHQVDGHKRFIDPIFMEALEPNDFYEMRDWFNRITNSFFGYSDEKASKTLLDMMAPENIKINTWISITSPDDVSTLVYCIRHVPEKATFPRGA